MPAFHLSRNGNPIQTIKFKHKIETGIEIGGLPGIVSELYIIAACNKANYHYYGDWEDLEEWQKAKLVGHYLSEILLDGVKNESVQEVIAKNNRRKDK